MKKNIGFFAGLGTTLTALMLFATRASATTTAELLQDAGSQISNTLIDNIWIVAGIVVGLLVVILPLSIGLKWLVTWIKKHVKG